MKKVILLFVSVIFINLLFADKLVLISVKNEKALKSFYLSSDVTINYHTDNLILATVEDNYSGDFILLDNNSWEDGQIYYIAWFHKGQKDNYPYLIKDVSEILYADANMFLIKTDKDQKIPPPRDGRVTKINKKEISMTQKNFPYQKGTLEMDDDIVDMIEAVDTVTFLSNLQHLQDYGTRNSYSEEAVLAQNWIKAQFEEYGYPVELFDFDMPSGEASDNVIATKTGTLYPDEYVILGGHYDTYSWSGLAPGADDDGTGTCGVMEAARVMADYDFDRTIIFCAWSGEEYGLYGSEAYASWAAEEGLNILGYFNIDMCGYLAPGDYIHTDMIAPESAQPLVDFYEEVCAVYLPDFIIEPGNLTGGNSDHTSFNENGFMGIFPFEDSQNYSPYIHTAGDTIGTSVNCLEMALMFTQAMVANVATMANLPGIPGGLYAVPGENEIVLNWDPLNDIDYYNIYKNENSDPIEVASTETSFTDMDVELYTTYYYYVTAVYAENGEESGPSNEVSINLLPLMSLPFADDFESDALYWSFEGSWGLATNESYSPTTSISDSPDGEYTNNQDISANLYNFNLAEATYADISFRAKYKLEEDYDFVYFQVSTDGLEWNTMDVYNGTENAWTEKDYLLDEYLGEPNVLVRFNFVSDNWVTDEGIYIDDFEINIEDISTSVNNTNLSTGFLNIYPNPADDKAIFEFEMKQAGDVVIEIFTPNGVLIKSISRQFVNSGVQNIEFSAAGLSTGIYYCKLKTMNNTLVKKIIISH